MSRLALSALCAPLVGFGAWGIVGCSEEADAPTRLELHAERTTSWSERGYARMTGALRPPTSMDGHNGIEVWIKLPDGAPIDVRSDGPRPHLVLPPGTSVDRVETIGGPDGVARVDDVRGTDLEVDGRERFHVLRRDDDRLVGFSWLGRDEASQRRADEALGEWLRGRGSSAREVSRLVGLNQCAHCHLVDKPGSVKANEGGLPNRPTDGHGFYQVEGVLRDEVAAETARPRDTNLDDPFITHRCATGDPPRRVETERSVHLRCADGSPPLGRLDVARALASEDAHATAVCASRAFLHARMTNAAREVFSEAFAVCGIRD